MKLIDTNIYEVAINNNTYFLNTLDSSLFNTTLEYSFIKRKLVVTYSNNIKQIELLLKAGAEKVKAAAAARIAANSLEIMEWFIPVYPAGKSVVLTAGVGLSQKGKSVYAPARCSASRTSGYNLG